MGRSTDSLVGDPSRVVAVLMPQATNEMEEGIVVAWCVDVGDEIEAGELLCEIETDKSVLEYEAPAAGRVARLVAPDDEAVAVGEPIAFLAPRDEDVTAWLEGQAPASDPATSEAPVASTAKLVPRNVAVAASTRVPASPAARRIARERGIDLASLPAGSGPGGRVLSSDVPDATVAASATPLVPSLVKGGGERRPMTRMRKMIARRLTASFREVPHFYCRVTIDAAPLLRFHAAVRETTGATINDVITLACARVIAEMPQFRTQIDGDDVAEFPHADIGVAVGNDDGLVVPVLLGVDELSLAELAAQAKDAVTRAREGRVDHVGQGVFTISNLGMFGVDEFTAIINPPEAAVLAVAAIREDVLVRDGAATPGKVLTLTLSNDHRLIDGIAGARFLARLRELLEEPDVLAEAR